MGTPTAAGPLAGIRVLDLTRALSGPFATMVLGDLGADVIKVEDIWHGDDTRRWGPPFQGDDAAYFLSINRNKRGLAVNLKMPEGREVARRLALASDIVIENFRPGTAARLGLGYDELARPNPRLIYVAGKYFATGVTPGPHGSAHESLVPYQVLPTADAPLMVAVGSDGLWRRFAEATGLTELADDPRYATNPDRVRNRDTLIPRISEVLAAKGCAEWTEILGQAGVPAGPVNTVPAALADPQVLAREMVTEAGHPVAGTIKMLGSPIKLSAQPAAIRRPPPALGQHTDEILAETGYTAAQIAELRAAGAIR